MASRTPPTPNPLEAFRNILRLEQAKGFADKAVMGGLDRFLARSALDIERALGRQGAARALLAARYATRSTPERQAWVGRWLAVLDGKPPSKATLPNATKHPESAAPARSAGPSPRPRPILKRKPAPEQSLDSPVSVLWGVNVATAERLERLGVKTVRDLLYHLPRRHTDFSRTIKIAQLVAEKEQTIVANVWEARQVRLGAHQATEAVVGDETGNVRVVWFGKPYLAKTFKPNARIAISGRPHPFGGRLQFESPEYEVLEGQDDLVHAGRLVPFYPLTQGLFQRGLRRLIWRTLERWLPSVQEFLPAGVRERVGLLPLPEALREAHFPSDAAALAAARRRLAFDELLTLQLAVLARRARWRQDATGVAIAANEQVLQEFLASLPFSLTEAQSRVLREALADMARGTPAMSRLLQGEVGSGKTVVALAVLLMAVAAGHQGALMAPTEVLAEQHFATVQKLLKGLAKAAQEDVLEVELKSLPKPVRVGLLVGKMTAREKARARLQMREGGIDVAVGTHALIQEEVLLPRLALAVVDEQHRFGVLQRAALRGKGEARPHVLVMSATPIPRTLALTLYGDLDISVLDELPPGRQKITTLWVPPDRRPGAYEFVRREVQQGRQAFVICPLIEESEAVEARAATEEYRRLSQEVFPDLRVALLHGRMPSQDKEEAMRRFRDGDADILVSTPVVEVGIDVPNATVMLIEAADRFGLAQLHQFRGRVGRGEHASYCMLLSDDPSPEARNRLKALEETNDGFKLAEIDLQMRGPGDFFGTRQSGLPDLRVAGLGDLDLLRTARQEAERIASVDPKLSSPEHAPLAREVKRFLSRVTEETS